MTTKKLLLIIGVLMILTGVVGIGTFYAYQKIKTVHINAIRAARQALDKHDAAQFQKFVDLDALINIAAEEILTAQINETIDPTAYSMDEVQRRYDSQKADFVQSARVIADEFISTGKVTFPQDLTGAQKFFKKSGVNSCEIRGVTKPRLEGDVQTATVTFYNTYMKFSFELELELTAAEENLWRVTSAKGFDSYWAGYRRSLKRKLDSLNAPIGRQMDEIFNVKSFSVKNAGGDEYGFSQNLNIAIKADVRSKERLSKIVGNIIIGKDENQSFSPFTIDMYQKPQGLQTFNVTKVLNPFVRADSNAMKHGLRKSDIYIEVTEIIFADGSKLKLLDELPE